MPVRDLVQHRIAGVTNRAVLVGPTTFRAISRVDQHRPAPFVGKKRVWELRRAQWIIDTGIHATTHAGGIQREHKFGLWLIETNNQPTGRQIFDVPNTAPSAVLNLYNAEQGGIRILDQFGITRDTYREVSGAEYGVGFGLSSVVTQTNTFPKGVFAVPERLYVKFVFRNIGNEDQTVFEVSGYCVLDFIERWVPTSEFLRLAGISRFGPYYRSAF